MCGIIGYAGNQEAQPILIKGLRQLAYRGYDSVGVVIGEGASVHHCKTVGKVDALEALLTEKPLKGTLGVGHTRWATHGEPSIANSHPHSSGSVWIVHNGIIENYETIKKELIRKGRTFASDTDSEVIAHLVDEEMKAEELKGEPQRLARGVERAARKMEGTYAVVAYSADFPDQLVAIKEGAPLAVGKFEGGAMVASDVLPLLDFTNEVAYLVDGVVVTLRRDGISAPGKPLQARTISWTPQLAEREGFDHYMLKEIYEQPRSVSSTLEGRLSLADGRVYLPELEALRSFLQEVDRIHLVACGTAWHASLVGKFLIEDLVRIPCEVDLASEYRYRRPIVNPRTLLILTSQSGETADTLAAMREGKARGARTLAICNVMDSTLARESDAVVYTRSGPEIGVASTKAFTTQMVAFHVVALWMAQQLDRIDKERSLRYASQLVKIPHWMEEVLRGAEQIRSIAESLAGYPAFLYIGRGINYPIALEGALKLKEITYLQADGYPAGEMKHGPIALVNPNLPVIVLAPNDELFVKMMSNIEEVKARKGIIIGMGHASQEKLVQMSRSFVPIPSCPPQIAPLLLSIPIQLLAYGVARHLGTDIDQPRNLAKSVTVE